MEEENRKLKIKLDQYRATILDERDIKNELVEKLNIIKQLVNTPLSRNRSSKAGKINFLAGSGSLQLNNNLTPIDIINEIKKIVSNE
tara:strand:- start:2525 stop:2785 length:261 start_codon:yes stop_codon:yes gene_type:complete